MGRIRAARDRQVSGLLVRALLDYVERAAGKVVADEVVHVAGLADRVARLDEGIVWFSVAEAVALADAARRICGDASIGRRIGEEQVIGLCETGLRDMLLAHETIPAAMEAVLIGGMKMSSGRAFEIVAQRDGQLVVESVTLGADAVEPLFCDYVQGVFATIPTVFGVVGRVIEPMCQSRGDSKCQFTLSWTTDPRREDVTVDSVASAARQEERVANFEYVQAMATDLLASHDLDQVLDRICDRAALSLEAPRFLLAVQVGTSDRVRVHQRGFSDDDVARACATRLLAGESIDGESVLLTDIPAPDGRHGVLAVLTIEQASFTTGEQRVLEAFARHAASALDLVEALDDAQRDRDTSRALLSLAGELAELGTHDEIASRLTRAVPAVVRSEHAMLWDWDGDHLALRLRATADTTARSWTGPTELRAETFRGLLDLAESPKPFVLRLADVPGELFEPFSGLASTMAAVPIVGRDGLIGILIAAFEHELDDDDVPQLMVALHGLAGHASTALENARLLEDIRHQALHDALTGLPNRPLVEDRANQCLAASARSGRPVSLLFVDLDRFKNVNDTLGHRSGDELIRLVAQRLQQIMRASDTLARLGGDEFVVLLPDATAEVGREVGTRIVQALRKPFVVGGREVFISCSVGVAAAPDDGMTYEALCGRADSAMYEAKDLGRNTVAVHSDDSGTLRQSRLALETALHRAVDLDQLRVLYQPQVDVRTGTLVGVEALVRWEHPELGLLAPDAFLELAEETGIIVEIDAHVRRVAFAQAARWAEEGTPIRVAVNLSARDVRDPALADRLASEIGLAGVDPSLIEVEITDRVAMEDDALTRALSRLKSLGVRLAIDDFGTGASVLGRLQRCQVDTLKIDRSFISAAEAGSADEQVVRALVTLGLTLDLEVVAEGVEIDEQHDLLRRCGCTLAQGFLFSRPVPAAEIDVLRLTQAATACRHHVG